jgi:hypothetical protein
MKEMLQNELFQLQDMKRRTQMQSDMRRQWETEQQEQLEELENKKQESADSRSKKESKQFKILTDRYFNEAKRRAESDVEYEKPKEPRPPVYYKSFSAPRVYYQPEERKKTTGT